MYDSSLNKYNHMVIKKMLKIYKYIAPKMKTSTRHNTQSLVEEIKAMIDIIWLISQITLACISFIFIEMNFTY